MLSSRLRHHAVWCKCTIVSEECAVFSGVKDSAPFYETKFLSDSMSYPSQRYSALSRPFKAYWLRDAPTGLTFNNSMLCPHCIYVFCIYLRTTSDFCSINWLVFITEMESVDYVVQIGPLNTAVCASSLKN